MSNTPLVSIVYTLLYPRMDAIGPPHLMRPEQHAPPFEYTAPHPAHPFVRVTGIEQVCLYEPCSGFRGPMPPLSANERGVVKVGTNHRERYSLLFGISYLSVPGIFGSPYGSKWSILRRLDPLGAPWLATSTLTDSYNKGSRTSHRLHSRAGEIRCPRRRSKVKR